MDNLTHSLMGLTIAKAGLERWSPMTTAVCVITANAPDADILALVGGRWAYLHHHRGITHSIVGTLTLALLIPSLFYLVDLAYARLKRRPPRIRFRGLLLASLITSATHPLMDWTNNYGVRPLLPWSGQWFYGDLVFILDPWLWLTLGGAAFLLTAQTRWRVILWSALALVLTAAFLFLPSRPGNVSYPIVANVLWITGLLGLAWAHRAKLARRFGKAVALAALCFVVVYWGGLALLHARALAQTDEIASSLARDSSERVLRTAAMPTLADPLRWQGMVETDRATYRFFLSLGESHEALSGKVRYEKPQAGASQIIAQVKDDLGARAFLEFARFPVFQVEGDCASRMFVQLADLRYTEPGPAREQRGTFALELPVVCPEQQQETGASTTR